MLYFDLPKEFKCCKWVIKAKKVSKGKIDCYEAELVVKGFIQQENINFTQTFSLVS